MKRAMAGLVAAVLMVMLAGCADEPTLAAREDAELDQLSVRAVELQGKVASTGRMTPELRGELTVLVQDVEAWQARTSRTDITVSRTGPADDGSSATSPLISRPGPTCTPCPLVKTFGNQVCFLVSESPCADGLIAKSCAYVCLTRTRSITATPAPTKTPGKS